MLPMIEYSFASKRIDVGKLVYIVHGILLVRADKRIPCDLELVAACR